MASAYEDDLHDLRIVLLGISGAGKSAIGNAILGREAFEESRTRESEKQTGIVDDRNISIVDTPGFFNTQLTDEELLKQMMKSLYLSHPGPHVFLLVLNLETFREEKRNIVEQIQENFGEEALLFTMVLFIGREQFSRRVLNRITESEETQKILNCFEGRFHVINNKNECDSSQIAKLLKSIDEMMKNNGGKNYSNEIYLRNQRKLREQKERMKQEDVKKTQEEKDKQEQQREINPNVETKTKIKEEKIKLDNEKKQEDATHLMIVLLGKSNVGKTATANTIQGRNVFRVNWTCTCEKRDAVLSGRTISIIDTPGLFDGRWHKHLQHELKRDIEKCLEMSAPAPHVFLLVIRLNGGDTEDEKNTVKWIQENFGEDAVRHTFVLFTHADLLKDESLDLYIRKSTDLQSLVNSCGGRFHSFNNQERNNQNQVTELLEKVEKLVKNNRGEHYNNEKSQRKKQEKKRQNNCQETIERQRDLNEADLRIVLLGLVGSGKSSTGNTILGRNAFKVSFISSTHTCKKQEVEMSERTISVIDTPGLIDGFSDHQQTETEKSLKTSAPGPHVFLLVINLMEERKTLKWIQENFENDALNYTIVLFTHADWITFLTDEPLNDYIKNNNALKSLIDSCGGRHHSFNNKAIRNHFQVIELFLKIDELMQRNGGGHYTKQNLFKMQKNKEGHYTKQTFFKSGQKSKQDTDDCEIL